MDSPVILDSATEFGRGIDLDRAFPGFPFDDVEGGFGRRSSDIRSHLDDLASRHPEFADHLLGPPWGDIPAFHTGSLRNRRRGSGSSSSHQGHPDDDARSQASGSSGTSAASGASGVSSQSDPSSHRSSSVSGKNQQQESSPNVRRNPIPQYGLRNTVDIGQHRHDMENPEKANRGQRSMSAPPENRQQDEIPTNIQESNTQQSPNQRFVSRVDITPQFQQPTGEKPAKQQQQQQQQRPQQGNVRHIPIFVEGRDEPVIPKNVDQVDHEPSTWSYTKPQTQVPPQFQQPPQFQSPPQFHRPSHFNQHYARGFMPNFEEEFYTPQSSFQQTFQQPRKSQHQRFTSQSPPAQSHFRQSQAENKKQQEQPFYGQQAHNQQHSESQSQQQQETNAEPRKQTQPKDPLEKVADVQKEVDSLTEQVNSWCGNSRKDKQYMYLDEMLTRELIKLDDIETEGKENVRQARKNAIKSIQDSISLLESKAPLPEQQQQQQQQQQEQQQAMELQETQAEVTNAENLQTVENKEETIENQQTNEQQAIPLPPAPSSPTKEPEVSEKQSEPDIQECQNTVLNQQNTDSQENTAQTAMESETLEKTPSVGSMEVQTAPETENTQVEEKPQTAPPVVEDTTKMEMENQGKSPKVAKKVKKSKKQQQQQTPICDGAIPLPAPETHQNDNAK